MSTLSGCSEYEVRCGRSSVLPLILIVLSVSCFRVFADEFDAATYDQIEFVRIPAGRFEMGTAEAERETKAACIGKLRSWRGVQKRSDEPLAQAFSHDKKSPRKSSECGASSGRCVGLIAVLLEPDGSAGRRQTRRRPARIKRGVVAKPGQHVEAEILEEGRMLGRLDQHADRRLGAEFLRNAIPEPLRPVFALGLR